MNQTPDILLIHCDQMSAGALGLYGNPVVKTPVLERLATSGMLFENAYCNYPACVPSRCSMMTGRYASTIRSHANFMHLESREISLPQVLREAGYATALIGKNHCFKNEDLPRAFDRVFRGDHIGVQNQEEDPELDASIQWGKEHCWGRQHHYGVNPHPADKSITARLCAEAVDVIRRFAEDDKPWFMWLSIPDPHTPYQVSEPYASLYDPATIPPPIEDSLEGKPERQKVAWYLDDNYKHDAEHFRRLRAIHYGMINQIDDHLGRVLDALEQAGRLENTVIVFTADHGDSMGDHGIIQKHNFFYDSFCKIPFIMTGPGCGESKRFAGPVELVDLMPTLLDLAGVNIPYGVQGKTLAPVLRGEAADHKEFIVIESGEAGEPPKLSDILDAEGKPVDKGTSFAWCAFREAWLGRGKCLRDDRWKLAVYANGEGELYDLDNDPDEVNNLCGAESHREVEQTLKEKLLHWCIENTDNLPENDTVGLSINRGLS